MEKYGNEYQRPLQLLLERFSQHDKLTQQYLAGDKQLRAEILNKQQEIDRAFELLEAVNEKLGTVLQFTEEGLGKARLAFGPFLVLAILEFMLFGRELRDLYLAWIWQA